MQCKSLRYLIDLARRASFESSTVLQEIKVYVACGSATQKRWILFELESDGTPLWWVDRMVQKRSVVDALVCAEHGLFGRPGEPITYADVDVACSLSSIPGFPNKYEGTVIPSMRPYTRPHMATHHTASLSDAMANLCAHRTTILCVVKKSLIDGGMPPEVYMIVMQKVADASNASTSVPF